MNPPQLAALQVRGAAHEVPSREDAPRAEAVTQTRGTTVLLLDASGSMSGSKFIAAKDAAAAFVQEARNGGQSATIIGFGSTATPVVPFGASPALTAAALAELQLLGSTNLTAALALARRFLDGAATPRTVVVVTDGMPDNEETALEEAATLKASGVTIHTVGIPVANAEFLARLAGSGARATSLRSETELKTTLRDVAQRLLLPPKTQR